MGKRKSISQSVRQYKHRVLFRETALIILIFNVIAFQDKLESYILACQDEETGGFADRPGDMVRLNVDQVELGDYLFSNIGDKLNDKGRTREN